MPYLTSKALLGVAMFFMSHGIIVQIEKKTLYQDELTTDKKPTVGYSIPDEIPTTFFQLCELV